MHHKQDIKVSICIVVYNHEAYLAQCLESLLNQNTNFKFEIIVGEDCSLDNTREILKDYVRLYPDIIVPIYHEENVGAVENMKQVYEKAQGKYIAHIDGDDYALPNKFQRQFDILEQNLDCQICSHSTHLVDANDNFIKNWNYTEGKFGLIDLYAQFPFFAHSSKMFRNDMDDTYWQNLPEQCLDVELHVKQTKKGKIYHISECLGAYRVDVGVSRVGKLINPVLPLGVIRAFDDGAEILLKGDVAEKYKKIYAKEMFNYSRRFLYTGSDYNIFCLLIKKSTSIKLYSARQLFMCLLTVLPQAVYFRMQSDKRLDI